MFRKFMTTSIVTLFGINTCGVAISIVTTKVNSEHLLTILIIQREHLLFNK